MRLLRWVIVRDLRRPTTLPESRRNTERSRPLALGGLFCKRFSNRTPCLGRRGPGSAVQISTAAMPPSPHPSKIRVVFRESCNTCEFLRNRLHW